MLYCCFSCICGCPAVGGNGPPAVISSLVAFHIVYAHTHACDSFAAIRVVQLRSADRRRRSASPAADSASAFAPLSVFRFRTSSAANHPERCQPKSCSLSRKRQHRSAARPRVLPGRPRQLSVAKSCSLSRKRPRRSAARPSVLPWRPRRLSVAESCAMPGMPL